MPETANTPSVKARQLCGPAIDVRQVGARPANVGEGCDTWSDTPVKGRDEQGIGHHARHIKKIIVKPYAGKPHVRFERGLMETGRR
jgi:hypothetical protein